MKVRRNNKIEKLAVLTILIFSIMVLFAPLINARSQDHSEIAEDPVEGIEEENEVIELPIFGEVKVEEMSLPILTILIGFVDGFNPCSLWLITFLLSIVIYTGSRKKVLAVGLTFLVVTAAVYGLFVIGVFNIFAYISYLFWIQLIVGLFALTFALVNIKDFFWYKKGISFTIPDKFKPKIIKNIRGVMTHNNTLVMMAATAVMAAGVALMELPCTAGFPVIWTGIVAGRGIQTMTMLFIGLLLLYLLVYLLVELIIFGSMVVTMKRTKLEEKHGRVLKLLGGMLMLFLAITIIFDPGLLENITSTLYLFGGAIIATAILNLIYKYRTGSNSGECKSCKIDVDIEDMKPGKSDEND
ncbi:MAG: hypothetical protein ACOCTT_01215 [archaeon]